MIDTFPAANSPPAAEPATRTSVVMATYNGTRFLDAQLASILGQLALDDEVVIVDDASTDGTAEAIAARAHPQIRLLRNPVNQGVLASFERGLRAARGVFIVLTDQDDIWLPDKLASLVAALSRDPQTTLALSDAQLIDADGKPLAPSFMATRGGFRGSLLATLIKNRYLGCAMAFRRELLDIALPFPAEVPMHDMWLGAINTFVGRVAYIDRPLMQYRRHGGNVSPSHPASLSQMLRWRVRLLRAVLQRRAARHRPAQSRVVAGNE